jgi:hypothetical protein
LWLRNIQQFAHTIYRPILLDDPGQHSIEKVGMNDEQRRRGAPGANRHNHRKRLIAVDDFGKRPNRRCVKKQADRKAEAEGPIDPGKQVDRQQRITPKIYMILRLSIERRRISVSHQDQAEKGHEVAQHNCRSQERKVPRQLMGETRMKCMV